jgi:hypothetical protein
MMADVENGWSMKRAWLGTVLLLSCLVGMPTALRAGDVKVPGASAHADAPTEKPKPWLLHLPGIAGDTRIDRRLLQGIRDAGFAGEIEIYDWTGDHPGLVALRARQYNDAEAQKIADKITDHYRADPKTPILITSHSGGTGLCVWALEKLPPDVKVERVMLLASALSPDYDLSKALSHVRGKAYAFSSPNDGIVLGAGTSVFGTIDGKQCQAAGLCGFACPKNADEEQYAKLVPMPYDSAWIKLGNIGDHIGVTSRAFAETVIAPILMGKEPPAPTTRPSARATASTTTRPASSGAPSSSAQ